MKVSLLLVVSFLGGVAWAHGQGPAGLLVPNAAPRERGQPSLILPKGIRIDGKTRSERLTPHSRVVRGWAYRKRGDLYAVVGVTRDHKLGMATYAGIPHFALVFEDKGPDETGKNNVDVDIKFPGGQNFSFLMAHSYARIEKLNFYSAIIRKKQMKEWLHELEKLNYLYVTFPNNSIRNWKISLFRSDLAIYNLKIALERAGINDLPAPRNDLKRDDDRLNRPPQRKLLAQIRQSHPIISATAKADPTQKIVETPLAIPAKSTVESSNGTGMRLLDFSVPPKITPQTDDGRLHTAPANAGVKRHPMRLIFSFVSLAALLSLTITALIRRRRRD